MSSTVKPGNLVLVATTIADDKQALVYAHVLSVGPTPTDAEGKVTGLPSLTVAFLPPGFNPHALGSVNWQNAFQRHVVHHQGHESVMAGGHSLAWLEVLPDPNDYPGTMPQLGVRAGVSSVYERETADAFFEKESKRVPQKIEAVQGAVNDYSQENNPADTSVVTAPEAAQ